MKNLLIIFSLILCSASTIDDRLLNEEVAVNITNCSQIISSNGGGYFLLEFGQNCSAFEVIIQSENDTSIFSLKASILKLQNTTNSSQDEPASDAKETSINVNIYERTVHQGHEYARLLAKWQFLNTTLTNHSYLSQTSRVGIHVKSLGNWSDYHLIFSYEEIQYHMHQENDSNDCGVIKSPNSFEGRYRPNTVILYRLKGSSNWSSTQIMVDEVDIDTSAGEYFLIGAGTTPFKGSPPLLISQPKRNSSYYVDDGSSYVMFVSSSTQKQSTGFKMRWEHTGIKTSIDENIPEDPYDALKSRLICFENATLALQEFEDPRGNEVMKNFRERFAEITIRYAEEKKIGDKEIFQKLNASSVFLYPMAKDPTKSPLPVTVQVKYKIHNKRVSLLSWKQLGEIVTKYEKEDENSTVLGYKVGLCSTGPVYISGTWSYLIYLSVPAFGVFFLLIWAWRQKVFDTSSCAPQKEQVDTNSNFVTVEPNVYEQTVPKVVETNEEGRRRTLVAQDFIQDNQEDKNAREIHMTDMTAIPTTSEDSGYGINFSFPRNKLRPSLKLVTDGEQLHVETIEKLVQLESLLSSNINSKQKPRWNQTAKYDLTGDLDVNRHEESNATSSEPLKKNESEHLYDSVSIDKSTKETKL